MVTTSSQFRRFVRESGRILLDLVSPRTCAACGTLTRTALCEACEPFLERLASPRCARCSEPVLTATSACTADHRRLRWLWFVRAPWRYRGAGGSVVRRFKFEGDAAAGEFLLRGMSATLRDFARGLGRRALLVHVPMHASRRRSRGFDQAERLATGVADLLGLEFLGGAMIRRRETLSQTDPRVVSREGNVEGAFAVRRPSRVRDRLIVLVDDVTTSGATARACAASLRSAGARRVALLTAAIG